MGIKVNCSRCRLTLITGDPHGEKPQNESTWLAIERCLFCWESDSLNNVTFPNGKTYPSSGYLFGPVKVTLNHYEEKSGQLSHTIPISAPLGTYTYHGYIGKPGEGVIDECHCDFEVTEAPEAVGAENWETMVDQGFSE